MQLNIFISIIIIVINMNNNYEKYVPRHASNYNASYKIDNSNVQSGKKVVKKKKES